jgi:hypothetical protein
MDYRDLAVDRIHTLVESAFDLRSSGFFAEADAVMNDANSIAEELRGTSQLVPA